MKRHLWVIIILFILFVFFGCSRNSGYSNERTSSSSVTIVQTSSVASATLSSPPEPETASPAPQTATPEITAPDPNTPETTTSGPSPTPEEPTPEPSETVPAVETYTSTELGLVFDLPGNWTGKYRVEEGDGYLSVFFTPAEPLGKSSWNGELFSIGKAHLAVHGQYIHGEWEFSIGGAAYTWGIFDGMAYGETAPEYGTYKALQNDIPAIYQTIRSVSGQAPDSTKRLWIETIPQNTGYETTMGLGITFTLPESWIGKCRIVEREDLISFYFKPEEPVDMSIGDGYLFCILRKTSEDDDAFMDSVLEFEVDGVPYISGTSTDASYTPDLPDYDTYKKMAGDRQEIIDTVRALK